MRQHRGCTEAGERFLLLAENENVARWLLRERTETAGL